MLSGGAIVEDSSRELDSEFFERHLSLTVRLLRNFIIDGNERLALDVLFSCGHDPRKTIEECV